MALSDNLCAAWELDEASGNAIDSFGANDGVETSGTIATGTGLIYGTARDFEATGDTEYFAVADHADVSPGDADFTAEVWVNPESTSGFPTVFSKGGTAAAREFILYLSAAKPQWEWRDSAANRVAAWSGTALSTSTWAQIICWHDAAANSIGVVVNAGTPNTTGTTGGANDTASELQIGAATSQTLYWDGMVQSLRFWKRVLTSDERTELYNAGAGRTYAYITGGGGGLSIPIAMHHYRHRLGV